MAGLATIVDFKVHQRLLMNTPTGGVVRRNIVSHDMQLDQSTSLSPAYHLTGTTGVNDAATGRIWTTTRSSRVLPDQLGAQEHQHRRVGWTLRTWTS